MGLTREEVHARVQDVVNCTEQIATKLDAHAKFVEAELKHTNDQHAALGKRVDDLAVHLGLRVDGVSSTVGSRLKGLESRWWNMAVAVILGLLAVIGWLAAGPPWATTADLRDALQHHVEVRHTPPGTP